MDEEKYTNEEQEEVPTEKNHISPEDADVESETEVEEAPEEDADEETEE